MIGAILAGGAGRRMAALGSAGKAAVSLAGRPLVAYPLDAMAAACERVVVVCKPSTPLPREVTVERWHEPEEPRHPLTGIVHALERAGAPVLVCAADMPFVAADDCRALIAAWRDCPARSVVATAGGRFQPVYGVYLPDALDLLRRAPAGAPLTETVGSLDPVEVPMPEGAVTSVDTPADLAAAERRMAARA